MIAVTSRLPTVAPTLIASVLLAAASSAAAHHSMAAFDMTQSVSLEGIVTRYEWANPHVYIWLSAPSANGETIEWEVEGQPPSMLRRLGWSPETLKVGDAVQATGNPARSAQRRSLLLAAMKRGETTLYDGGRMVGALTTVPPPPAAAAAGIAGVWVTVLDMGAMGSYLNPARTIPLTEAGAAARAAFDEKTMSAGLRCIPTPAPAFMFAPDVKRITVEKGAVRIGAEFANGERVIHLASDTSTPPAPTPSVQGRSIGRWEGSTLVIETTEFAPHAGGIGFTLGSTPQKRLSERLTLDEDGRGLTYTFELSDPGVLTAPMTGQSRWVYSPDVEFAPVACDLENARRFLE